MLDFKEKMTQGLMDSWPFKMGPVRCPKTTGRNYQYTLRNNQEESAVLN